ncbi:MAG: HAD family hydrolase [Desulfobacterales bacterium]
MIANGIQSVIFDCDGVLFDTTRANTLYYNRLLARFDLAPMTPEQFAYCQMHTVDASMKFLFEERGLLRAAQELRGRMGYWDLVPEMDMEPDLVGLLDTLRPRFRTAVATNRSDTMNRVLEVHGLVGRFDLVVTALDVNHAKPAPDMLIKVLESFRIGPDQAVYVGDSELDETAARAARIPLIAFRNPALNAAAHVDRLSDILPLLPL